MPSEDHHLAVANRTKRTCDHLMADPPAHSPWIAITAFYQALQLVEAVFANESPVCHSSDHQERERHLKQTRKYQHTVKHYLPLKRASEVARYLSGHTTFDDFLTPEQVVKTLVEHHLHKIKESAKKMLSGKASIE